MKAEHQKQGHTPSYYAATANDHAGYPALMGGESVDVAVVGAGFTGSAFIIILKPLSIP